MKKTKNSSPNILITSVSAKVSLVKAFKKALKQEGTEGKVIGVDIDKYSPAFCFCDDCAVCPKLTSDDYLRFVIKLCKDNKIGLIIPTRDDDVVFFSNHIKDFIESGVIPTVPSYKTAKICSDKFLFFEFLSKNNIPTIKSWKDINEEITYPCVIKDRVGAGARNFHIANDLEELRKKIKLVEKPIIQELVIGTEYTIDYFADFNGNPVSVVPRIRLKVENGESKVGITKNDEEIIKLSKELGRKIGLVGHNIIQCFKLKNGSIEFIEINPRFGGGSNLCFAAGAETPKYLLQLLNNKKIDFRGFKEDLLMMRYSKDCFIEENEFNFKK